MIPKYFQDSEVKQAFGLDRKAKWPEHGMANRLIHGVDCWVEPVRPGFHIRARCTCPTCGKDIPIGRFHQHMKVHK